MNLPEKVIIPTLVMARRVGDETVILDLASGTYFGLDPVGARIWQLMADGLTLGQVCDAIFAQYDSTPEKIQHDVLALARTLAEKGLISASVE